MLILLNSSKPKTHNNSKLFKLLFYFLPFIQCGRIRIEEIGNKLFRLNDIISSEYISTGTTSTLNWTLGARSYIRRIIISDYLINSLANIRGII